MIARSVSRSRWPVSGSWVVIAQRGTGVLMRRSRRRARPAGRSRCPPRAARPPSSSMSIRNRRASMAPAPRTPRERLDRAVGDERRRVRSARPARPVAADEADARPGNGGERRGPRAVDDVPDAGPAVDRGLDRLAEPDLVLDDRAVGERHPQERGVGVGVGLTWTSCPAISRSMRRFVVVDEEEPAVLEDALLLELDLVAVLQPEAAHGRDARRRRSACARCYRTAASPADLTSGRRRSASPGSARGAPPRCPSRGRAACRAGR